MLRDKFSVSMEEKQNITLQFLRWPKKITVRTTMAKTTTNKLHNNELQ